MKTITSARITGGMGGGDFHPTSYRVPGTKTALHMLSPSQKWDEHWKNILFQCLSPLYFFANSSTEVYN